MTRTARVRVAGALLLLGLCAVFTPLLVTPSRPPLLAAAATTPVSDQVETPTEPALSPVGDDEGMADLYGNEVTSAVAKYSFDATGSLYELHSPQTELPRLASPKS